MISGCMMLKRYPTRIIPATQIAMNIPRSFGFTAFLNMIIEGSDSVVTAIMNASTVPRSAPFAYRVD